MRITGLVVLFCSLALQASADDLRTIVRGIVDSTGSHAADTLIGRDLTGVNQVTVTCYYWASAGSVCAGGGDFDDAGPCDTGTDNGATIIRSSTTSHHCWYRKNFGLNGVVDARQCGVVGDGLPAYGTPNVTANYHPADGARLQQCMNIAASLSVPDGDQNPLSVVNTGGGVILDNTTQLQIPGGVELTCGATQPAGNGGNDFRVLNNNNKPNISNALAISPQIPVTGSGPLTDAILISGKGSSLRGCLVEASDGGADNLIDPYAPSVWYPQCDSTASYMVPCTPLPGTSPPDIRSALLEYSAFNPHRSVAYSGGGPASASVGIQSAIR